MTVYARSDITTVAVAEAGHSHTKKPRDDRFIINCPACEPELVKMGWATAPMLVELTPDEVREAENAERDIALFQQQQVAASAREASAAIRATSRGKS